MGESPDLSIGPHVKINTFNCASGILTSQGADPPAIARMAGFSTAVAPIGSTVRTQFKRETSATGSRVDTINMDIYLSCYASWTGPHCISARPPDEWFERCAEPNGEESEHGT